MENKTFALFMIKCNKLIDRFKCSFSKLSVVWCHYQQPSFFLEENIEILARILKRGGGDRDENFCMTSILET